MIIILLLLLLILLSFLVYYSLREPGKVKKEYKVKPQISNLNINV